ncbi:MAG: transcription-repair coupling factor [Phycisphaerae bacterium]|nr:transcription-repair coupling factor [Phycisphaerae bacterium]
MTTMIDRVLQSDLLRQAAGALRAGQELKLAGVWGASTALLAAALGRLKRAPVLLVVNHLDDADAAADDIEVFLKELGAVAQNFPAWEAQLATDHVSEEVTGERLRLLNLLADPDAADEPVEFIVAPVMALLQPVPTPEALEAGRLHLTRGQAISPDDLLAWLADGGYEHVDQVDRQGEFAHRGGIVDIFPPGARTALRAEFFGDELESLRLFDLDSQRSVEEVQACDITAMTVGRSMDRLIEDRDETKTDAPATTNLFDYLPPNTLVCMAQPGDVRELAEQLYSRIRDDLADEASPVALRRVDEIFSAMERFTRVTCHLFAGVRGENAISMGIRSLERLAINTAEALAELEELSAENDVWVYCESTAERERFDEMLQKHHPKLRAKVKLAEGHVSGGFHWPALKLVVVGHSEIYHRYAKVRRIRRVRAGRPIQSMLDLSEGDYVVHVGHGIAKFEGLRRMERDGASEEYLRLLFADHAVLHVPVTRINLVQKYIGTKHKRPSLSKLGGKHWARAKERVGEAVKDLAGELLRLQAVRRASPGESYPIGTDLQRQLADEFPYTETEDQSAALMQIDSDMAQPRPMDRLVCGDVGYGKTELAIRAAMKVVEAGRQVAVLVPTTVLADQHYRTFTERFADFPVSVDVISRFRTAGQQAEILKRLQLGQIDVLIGTHRLLSKDVRFPNLGLVVIDEEQRFGVMHKEHMKQLRATLDVLTLTATPIPRTLHMALLGLRDISSLQTPPMDRRAIHTEVCDDDDELIRTAISRELNRNGQVFFVHNRVQDIESVARRVQSLSGDARVEIGHGQMPERGLERVMMRFNRGEIDVLVCTTIIESGLDIPTANTMLIHEADRFGLAELHQLRGRVGRYKHRAYCYLLLPSRRTVSPVAAKRLKAIEDFSDLGAGFQIAMRDLEIRGAGNILGPQQSGHIALVGYELYCELLEQAVRQLKGEAPPPRASVHIELGLDAYIPRSYISSERQRMEIYRRLVLASEPADLAQLRADLHDAYGPLPSEVEQLLDAAELRVRAAAVGVQSMVRMTPDIIFRVRDFQDHQSLRRVFEGVAGSVRVVDQHTLHWRPPKNYLEMPTLLTVLLKRFRE